MCIEYVTGMHDMVTLVDCLGNPGVEKSMRIGEYAYGNVFSVHDVVNVAAEGLRMRQGWQSDHDCQLISRYLFVFS